MLTHEGHKGLKGLKRQKGCCGHWGWWVQWVLLGYDGSGGLIRVLREEKRNCVLGYIKVYPRTRGNDRG